MADKRNRWTKEELEIINSGKYYLNELVILIPNHSYTAIAHKCKRLGKGKGHHLKYGDKPSTNAQRKAKYNAKIKQIGYKPLYTII